MREGTGKWTGFKESLTSQRGRLRAGIGVVALIDLAIVFLASYSKTAKIFPVAWSIGALGIVTFLGYYMIENYVRKQIYEEVSNRSEEGDGDGVSIQSGVVQNAIATTFMIVYFAVMGQVLFGPEGSGAQTATAKTLIGNFTTLFQFVIAFYFGAKAATAIGTRVKASPTPGPTPPADGPKPDGQQQGRDSQA